MFSVNILLRLCRLCSAVSATPHRNTFYSSFVATPLDWRRSRNTVWQARPPCKGGKAAPAKQIPGGTDKASRSLEIGSKYLYGQFSEKKLDTFYRFI